MTPWRFLLIGSTACGVLQAYLAPPVKAPELPAVAPVQIVAAPAPRKSVAKMPKGLAAPDGIFAPHFVTGQYAGSR